MLQHGGDEIMCVSSQLTVPNTWQMMYRRFDLKLLPINSIKRGLRTSSVSYSGGKFPERNGQGSFFCSLSHPLSLGRSLC